MRELLKKIGYANAEDAIDFVMAGLAILPGLLMLSGFVVAGAAALFILIMLLAIIGLSIPVPPAPPIDKSAQKDKKPSL